jgi:hypothetical protein
MAVTPFRAFYARRGIHDPTSASPAEPQLASSQMATIMVPPSMSGAAGGEADGEQLHCLGLLLVR